MKHSLRALPAVAAVLGCVACSSPDDASGDLHLELVSAPTSITPGTSTPQVVLVKVVNGDNTPVAGVPVSWTVKPGGGQIDAAADTSGVDGLAAAQWTPGLQTGTQEIGAYIHGDPALVITVSADAFHADRIDAGYRGVCGLQGTATWCWARGRNNNQTFRILSQVQATALALSDAHACVVDTAGLTYCYRYDQYSNSTDPNAFQSVTGLPAISAISAGDNYFCGTDAADLTPWCWAGSSFSANHVSTTLRLTSISAGNYRGCGLADDGAAWCWESFDAPTPVPGGHVFRQVSLANYTACAIEAPARLYCWDPGQPPTLIAGVAPASIAMGFGTNLMNLQSSVRSFYVDEPAVGVTFLEEADFDAPAIQISGDDNSCVITVEHIVYCQGMNYAFSDGFGTDWAAIPAPLH